MKHVTHRLITALYFVFVLAVLGMMLHFLVLRPVAEGPAARWVFVALASGGMLMMAIYNIALYLFRPSEKAALYFALFCLGAAVRFFFMEGNLGHALLPALSPFAVVLLQYLPFGVQVISVTSFVFEVFGQDRYKKLKYILNIIIAADILIILTFGLYFTWMQSILGLLVGIPFIVACIITIAKSPEFKKNRLSILYLATYIMYLFSFTRTVTANASPPYIAVVFNYLFAIAHAILLSDRYARAIKAVETAKEELEEKVAERTAELRAANESLAASEKNIRDVVVAISHDLKTPLSALGVNLEMMTEDDALSVDSKRHLGVAYNKHHDLARLLGSLLDAVNMGEGKIAFHMDWMPLGALMLDLQDRYDDDALAAGVLLAVSFKRDCSISADAERLWSVFDNIIGNALRYTPKGGAIRVEAGEPENGFVSISVKDTGCGIAPEHLPRIFEQYYKADASRGGTGNGLGLYIVKTAAEGMSGTVTAQSEIGKGCEIIIRLKAAFQ